MQILLTSRSWRPGGEQEVSSATEGAAQLRRDPHIKGGTNVAAANEPAAAQLRKKV